MVLNIYVDDLTLAGAAKLHGQFWKLLREKIKLDPEAEVLTDGIRILGRLHCSHRTTDGTTLTLDMGSYAQQVVELYAELADIDKDNREPRSTCLDCDQDAGCGLSGERT